jgi:aldehyde dehydrogenase (NAD+)
VTVRVGLPERDRTELIIGGWPVPPAGGELIEVRSTGPRWVRPLISTPRPPAKRSTAVRGPSRPSPNAQRVIRRFDKLQAAQRTEIAELVSAENGTARWFGDWVLAALTGQTGAYLRAAESLRWEEGLLVDGPGRILVRREPVGVVAAVIAWNSPQQSALVKLVPAPLAGCCVILKACPETALDACCSASCSARPGCPRAC